MAALSVLCVSELNIQQYAQGNFSDVAADIRGFLSKNYQHEVLLTLCQEFSIDGAFNLRKELIALKKVLLRLSEKSSRQTRTLSRLTTWFYSDIIFDGEEHGRDRWSASADYKSCSDALHLSKGTTISLVEARGIMKCLCCLPRFPREGPLSSFGGPTGRKLVKVPYSTTWYKTLKDANNFLSSIGCEANFHWEDKLIFSSDLVSPELSGWNTLQRIKSRVAELVVDPNAVDQISCCLIARGVWKACEMRYQAFVLCLKLQYLVSSVKSSISLLEKCTCDASAADMDGSEGSPKVESSVNTDDFNKKWMLKTHGKKHLLRLRTSLIVVDEMSVWLKKLLLHTHVRHRWPSCLFASAVYRNFAHSSDNHLCDELDVSSASQVSSEEGMSAVWHVSYEPMFQAGDGVLMAAAKSTDMQAMYFPAAFAKIPSLVEENSSNVERFFPLFVNAVGSQVWPPNAEEGGGSVKGSCLCHCCHGTFSKIWIDIWLNSQTMTTSGQIFEDFPSGGQAEQEVGMGDATSASSKKNARAGSCVEGVCCECVRRFKEAHRCCSQHLVSHLTAQKHHTTGGLQCGSMFCPHRLYCPVHDGAGQGSFFCFECGIHKGDGGDVQQLCASLARLSVHSTRCSDIDTAVVPSVLLFLDFDRTLCSSKSGADPDPIADATVGAVHQTTKHSIDDDLRESTSLPGVDKVFVITRNSHGESICRFLAKNDCRVDGVHVVAKKSSGKRQGHVRIGARSTENIDIVKGFQGQSISELQMPDGQTLSEGQDGLSSATLHRSRSTSKAEVILQLMRQHHDQIDGSRSVVGVYVDDDIQELCEGWASGRNSVGSEIAADGVSFHVHRFLFCRGAI